MNAINRSITDIFHGIAGNLQEIIRSELLLAKTEVKEEASKAIQPAVRLGVGAALGLFACAFGLLTIMFLLWIVLPIWIAALVVTFLVGLIALALIRSGMAGFQKIRPAPERTLESVKENMEWAKGQMP